MSGNAAGRSYLEADIRTASPLRLVVLACDIGIEHIRRALDAIDGDNTDKVEVLDRTSKAREAVLELMGAVNSDKAPEIADNLLKLYAYFFRRLTDGCINMDAEALREVMKLWSELRDGWNEMLTQGLAAESASEPNTAGRLVSVTG